MRQLFQPWPIFIGLRYSRTKRSAALVAFLSFVSMVGLAISVALLILVLAVMNGFDREMRQRILGLVPHVVLYQVGEALDWRAAQATVMQHPRVVSSAPYTELNGLLMKGAKVSGAVLYGIDPQQEAKVSIVGDYISGATLNALAEQPNSVLLGRALADKLAVAVGDGITLVLPEQRPGEGSGSARMLRLTVLGVIDTGTEVDQNLALIALNAALALTPPSQQRIHLRVTIDDVFAAPEVSRDLDLTVSYGYYLRDWTRSHGNLYAAIQLSRELVVMMLMIIIAVAAFNVISSLIMVVNDKQGDIAILRSQGARPRAILAVFMVLGTAIGCIGTGLGVVLGVALSFGVTHVVPWLEQVLGVRFLNSDVYPINYLPVDLRLADVVMVCAVALAMSFVATLYPAWRAAKVQPAEALRYD